MVKKLSINVHFSREISEDIMNQLKNNLVNGQGIIEKMEKIYSNFDPDVRCDVTYE